MNYCVRQKQLKRRIWEDKYKNGVLHFDTLLSAAAGRCRSLRQRAVAECCGKRPWPKAQGHWASRSINIICYPGRGILASSWGASRGQVGSKTGIVGFERTNEQLEGLGTRISPARPLGRQILWGSKKLRRDSARSRARMTCTRARAADRVENAGKFIHSVSFFPSI